MKRIKGIYLGLLAVLLSPMAANAVLIESDLLASGDGLLFIDTVGQREWVDVNKTTGMSVNTFLNSSIYSGQGFTLATTSDITELFLNAGAAAVATGGGTNYQAGSLAAALTFYDLFEHAPNYTQTGGNPWIHGYEDFGSPTQLTIARLIVNNRQDPSAATTATFDVGTNGTGWTRNSTNRAVGVWAYRPASVPEPGTMALFGIGLAGMGLARRRRKA